MNLAGPGAAEQLHDLPGGRSAHDRVVDDDHAFAFHDALHRRQFHPYAQVPQVLGGLDERSRDIHVLQQAHLQGNVAGLGIADGGAHPGFRNAHHQVRLRRVLSPEQGAGPLAESMHAASFDIAVRTGEIDVFHRTHPVLGPLGMLKTRYSVLVDADQFAGFDVPEDGRADEMQRAGLAGDDITVSDLPDGQGPEAVSVAAGIERVGRQDDRGEGSVQLVHGGQDVLRPSFAGCSHQEREQLAVRSGDEEMSLRLNPPAEDVGIDDVSVMGEGEGARLARHLERLEILGAPDLGRGIADVADAGRAGKRRQLLLSEDFPHEAGVLVETDVPVGAQGGDAASLLSAVLQDHQGLAGHERGPVHAEAADYAALLVQFIFPEKAVFHLMPWISCGKPGRPSPVP